MSIRISLLLAAALLAYGAQADAARIYKCRQSRGELAYQDTPCERGSQTVSARQAEDAAPPEAIQLGTVSNGVLTLKQRGNGHYFVDGSINSKPLVFVIDTGASVVSLPRPIANRAQLYCQEQVMMQTARGAASACKTTIPVLIFGPYELHNVTATIFPDLKQPLLGMSVLQLFKLEQENGELRISPRK